MNELEVRDNDELVRGLFGLRGRRQDLRPVTSLVIPPLSYPAA